MILKVGDQASWGSEVAYSRVSVVKIDALLQGVPTILFVFISRLVF